MGHMAIFLTANVNTAEGKKLCILELTSFEVALCIARTLYRNWLRFYVARCFLIK